MEQIELRVNNSPLASATITEWQEVEFSCTPPPGCTPSLAIGPPHHLVPLLPFLRPGEETWRWAWNPRNTVGRLLLALELVGSDGRIEHQHTTLIVRPRKLDQQEYAHLLNDLQQTVYAVVLSLRGRNAGSGGLAGATLTTFPPADSAEHHPLSRVDSASLLGEATMASVWLSYLEGQLGHLEQAVRRIARNPHTRPRPTTQRVPTEQAHTLARVSHDLPAFATLPAGDGREEEGTGEEEKPPLPARISHPVSGETTDTYENRLLAHVLNEHWRRVHSAARLARDNTASATLSPEHIAPLVRRIEQLRSLPFLAEVGPLHTFHGASQVMRRSPPYRQIYRFWQDLQRIPWLSLESSLFHLPIGNLPYLYECWCVLQVLRTLLDLPGATVQQQQLVALKKGDGKGEPHTFSLREDEPLLTLHWRGYLLTLRYQPRYAPPASQGTAACSPGSPGSPGSLVSLDCHTHIPDLSLEIRLPDHSDHSDHPGYPDHSDHPDHPDHSDPLPALLIFDAKYRLSASGSVPDDALSDGYTYLGSIGHTSGKRAVRAALVCFPGSGPAEHYASGVGLLPLRPGHTGPLNEWLPTFLASYYARAPYALNPEP